MLSFQRLRPEDREKYQALFREYPEKGCEYAFANLCMWGRQRVCFRENAVAFFSQFDRLSIYPFPVGTGDLKPMLDAIIHDAQARGIPCRITSMTKAECDLLESLYPGRFRFHTDRDGFDYVYAIEALATLKGKRYQSKRNFVNRFWAAHPDCKAVALTKENLDLARDLAEKWYEAHQNFAPLQDFHLERLALERCFACLDCFGMEGLLLVENGQALAMAIGSRLNDTTFDIHFEKALGTVDGAYAAINQAFAAALWEKYPALQYLNREDDLGIEGLRKAKLSYHPDHMVEKYWARLWEDDDEI